MGGLGLLLFLPAYFLLQKGIIDYKSLLLFEGIFLLVRIYFQVIFELIQTQKKSKDIQFILLIYRLFYF